MYISKLFYSIKRFFWNQIYDYLCFSWVVKSYVSPPRRFFSRTIIQNDIFSTGVTNTLCTYIIHCTLYSVHSAHSQQVSGTYSVHTYSRHSDMTWLFLRLCFTWQWPDFFVHASALLGTTTRAYARAFTSIIYTTKYEVRNFITKLKQQYKCNVSIFTEISWSHKIMIFL